MVAVSKNNFGKGQEGGRKAAGVFWHQEQPESGQTAGGGASSAEGSKACGHPLEQHASGNTTRLNPPAPRARHPTENTISRGKIILIFSYVTADDSPSSVLLAEVCSAPQSRDEMQPDQAVEVTDDGDALPGRVPGPNQG